VKLYYYRAPEGNFGDDLNGWLWPKLLPGIFDTDENVLFFGIGTILNSSTPQKPRKIIFGSGAAYPEGLPDIDDKWSIRALRGPLTAQALGVDACLAITDPAALISTIGLPQERKRYRTSYIPQYRSALTGQWKKACNRAGINYIDPRDRVDRCLQAIRQSERVICESMHGAIVSDALRTPWLAIRANNYVSERRMNQFKWMDWSSSLGLKPPSETTHPLWRKASDENMWGTVKRAVKEAYVAHWLKRLSLRGSFQLSREKTLQTAISRYQDELEKFRKEFAT